MEKASQIVLFPFLNFYVTFAFLRGHYPEQVHRVSPALKQYRVNSQLGPSGLSLPWLINISEEII
jgi:hypothetical protein